MKHIEVTNVFCVAAFGAALNEAIKDAITLAMQRGETVSVEHNGRQFLIEPGALIGHVIGTLKGGA